MTKSALLSSSAIVVTLLLNLWLLPLYLRSRLGPQRVEFVATSISVNVQQQGARHPKPAAGTGAAGAGTAGAGAAGAGAAGAAGAGVLLVKEQRPQPIGAEQRPQPIGAEQRPQPIGAEQRPQPIGEEQRPQPIGAASAGIGIGSSNSPSSSPPASSREVCDVFVGRWEYDPNYRPLYTERSCKFIQPSQNCFANGRPDREFLKWRWRPAGCQLPLLDPFSFLQSMRGKRMVFIGDSIARNHMQSLLCALAQVEEPVKIYFDKKDKEMKWGFPKHDFVLANLWSPFLVEHTAEGNLYRLQLDVPDSVWASQLHTFNIAVISSGYWFFRPSVYYLNKRALGCNPLAAGLNPGLNNMTTFEVLPAYSLAHRNMLAYLSERFDGVVMLRTLTIDHFEHGSWDTGGLCNRTTPYRAEEFPLPWMTNEMYRMQVQAFQDVVAEQQKQQQQQHHHHQDQQQQQQRRRKQQQQQRRRQRLGRMKLFNVTHSVLLRPDGHPNSYRGAQQEAPGERPQNDCLHWCLPGPIDTWNEFLAYLLSDHSRDIPADGSVKI